MPLPEAEPELLCLFFTDHDRLIAFHFDQTEQFGTYCVAGQDMLGSNILNRTLRHLGRLGIARILDDRYSATPLDAQQPGRAVVEAPAEHNSDNP